MFYNYDMFLFYIWIHLQLFWIYDVFFIFFQYNLSMLTIQWLSFTYV